jgi:hypothetical protein
VLERRLSRLLNEDVNPFNEREMEDRLAARGSTKVDPTSDRIAYNNTGIYYI